MAQESGSLRVAISGGGLAGASLFHALTRKPHLDVHIFESASEFREAGAAVGISNQAQTALRLIGPSAVESFQRAGAVFQKGAHLVLAQGANAGETVGRIGGDKNATGIVHRAEFLRELLARAPADRMHVSKKVQKVERNEDGPITLGFSDGTTHECDVLIGADGIHSSVRKYVLGDDPAALPVPAGWWVVQVLKPYDEVAALMGKSFLDTYLNLNSPGEVGWIGDGALIFHSPLSDSKLAQFVIVSCHDEASTDWQKVISSNEIREKFAGWPADLFNAVDKLICTTEDSHKAICFWQHLPAKTYVRGNVAVTGDAAHATTAWQGSGAGMSIEDSMILATLLERAKSAAQARVALRVFDSVRRGRTQRVVESSKCTGRMVTGQDPETGLDAVKLQNALRHRWDFILDFDVEEHRDKALRQMEAELNALYMPEIGKKDSLSVEY